MSMQIYDIHGRDSVYHTSYTANNYVLTRRTFLLHLQMVPFTTSSISSLSISPATTEIAPAHSEAVP